MKKITDDIPSEDEMFKIGKFKIGRYKGAKYALWLENEGGEGMVVNEVDLDMILQGYFNKNF